MHIRNDGKPFNAWRFDKWNLSAQAAMARHIIAPPPIRISRWRILLATFVMWLYSRFARKVRYAPRTIHGR